SAPQREPATAGVTVRKAEGLGYQQARARRIAGTGPRDSTRHACDGGGRVQTINAADFRVGGGRGKPMREGNPLGRGWRPTPVTCNRKHRDTANPVQFRRLRRPSDVDSGGSSRPHTSESVTKRPLTATESATRQCHRDVTVLPDDPDLAAVIDAW